MKFLTKQDWESLLSKLGISKNKSTGQNKETKSDNVETLFIEIFQIIQDICLSKRYDHTTFGLSMTFFHYYICFNDYRRINTTELAFACFFMSTKIQFFNLEVKNIIKDYNEYIKNKPAQEKKTEPDFIKYEIQLYSQLGYDLDIETPYQMYYLYIRPLVEKFPGIKIEKLDKMKHFCFNLISDTYAKPLSIYYHPKIIYLSCIIFTIKFLDINEIDINKLLKDENLELIGECMEYIYDIYAKYIENS